MDISNDILPFEAIIAIAKSITLEMRIADIEKPLYLSQNKAFVRYGTAKVKRWLSEGKVRINEKGGKKDKNKDKKDDKVGKYDLRFEDLERCAISEEYTHGVIEKRKYVKKNLI